MRLIYQEKKQYVIQKHSLRIRPMLDVPERDLFFSSVVTCHIIRKRELKTCSQWKNFTFFSTIPIEVGYAYPKLTTRFVINHIPRSRVNVAAFFCPILYFFWYFKNLTLTLFLFIVLYMRNDDGRK